MMDWGNYAVERLRTRRNTNISLVCKYGFCTKNDICWSFVKLDKTDKNACRILARKPVGKQVLGKPRRKENIKMDL
jgi:hypothetical protein